MPATINQKLCMSPTGRMPVIHVGQYDSDFSIVFSLYSVGNAAWTMESGTTAKIRGTKTDGTGYSADCTVDITNKKVTVTGDQQMTAAAGNCIYEIVLYKGTKELSSVNFILKVERAALDAETIPSESKIKEIQDLGTKADEIIEAYENLQFDETPTAGSTKAVKSGGIKTYVDDATTSDPTLSLPGKPADAEATGIAIADLSSGIDRNNELLLDAFDLGPDVFSTANASNKTHKGVTYTWSNGSCAVSGTATALSFCNFRGGSSTLPAEYIRGEKYKITVNTDDPNIILHVIVYTPNGNQIYDFNNSAPGILTIPLNATAAILRYQVEEGNTVSGTVTCSACRLISVDETFDEYTEQRNIESGYPYNCLDVEWNSGSGWISAVTENPLSADTYTLYANITSTNTDVDVVYIRAFSSTNYDNSNLSATATISKGGGWTTLNATNVIRSIFIMAGSSSSASSSYTLTVTGSINMYHGLHIDDSGSGDITGVLNTVLDARGFVKLPAGDFYIRNVSMPAGSMLCGSGDSTKLYFNENVNGTAITMGNRSTVKNLTLYGASADITLPSSSFEPTAGETDYLSGVTWSSNDGFTSAKPNASLTAGTYTFYIHASSTNTGSDIYIRFLKSETYSSSNVMLTLTVENGSDSWVTVKTDDPIKSVFVFAGSNTSTSAGYTLTFTEPCELRTLSTLIGDRHGIKWESESVEFGLIENCRIERFNGSGIIAKDTMTPVDNNLAISDCFVRNCVVGLYIQKNSEFMKIDNNTIVRNYYGILNRGGNNNISNCGIDGNVVGIQVDADEGSNGGHGTISNCSINHSDNNTGYGLIIKGTGRELVNNCNFYYSKVLLQNTNGNVISNCGFGNDTGIEISGGQGNVVTDCMMLNTTSTPITITDNSQTVIHNCYTRLGKELPSVGDSISRIDTELAKLKDLLFYDPNDSSLWEVGAINSSGGDSSSTTRIRTSGYISDRVVSVGVTDGYRYNLVAYSDGVFEGMWNGSEFVESIVWLTEDTNLTSGYSYRVVLAAIKSTTMEVSDYSLAKFTALKDLTNTENISVTDTNSDGNIVISFV